MSIAGTSQHPVGINRYSSLEAGCLEVTALKSYPYDVRITKYIGTKIEMVPYDLHN
jgi:hypothetical protein